IGGKARQSILSPSSANSQADKFNGDLSAVQKRLEDHQAQSSLTGLASFPNTPRWLSPRRPKPALRGPPCSARSNSIPPHSFAGSSPPPPNDIRCRRSSPLTPS